MSRRKKHKRGARNRGLGAASRALARIAEPCTGLYRRRGSDLESHSGDDPAGGSNDDLPRADNRSVDWGSDAQRPPSLCIAVIQTARNSKFERLLMAESSP